MFQGQQQPAPPLLFSLKSQKYLQDTWEKGGARAQNLDRRGFGHNVPLTPADVADSLPIAFSRELADIATGTKILKAFNGKPHEGSVTATAAMDGVYLHVVTYDAGVDDKTMTWREVERAHQAPTTPT